VLSYILYIQEKKTIYQSVLAPFYQVLGKPIQMADKVLNKGIEIVGADEKEYGESVKAKFSYLQDSSKDRLYLEALLNQMGRFQKKDFIYDIYILDSYSPNAFAMPGGTIFVTKGLLEIVQSESELVSIIAHELGHIEKGHCFDRVKFELLAKKAGIDSIGQLADFIFSFVVQTAYNKNQEDEADEYAFQLILETEYDPSALGKAFQRLSDSYPDKETRKNNVLMEYFQSHPHTKLREEKFKEKSKAWWILHESEKRYVGIKNLQERTNYKDNQLTEEWIEKFND
jgi:predicted Zn-dependent protease